MAILIGKLPDTKPSEILFKFSGITKAKITQNFEKCICYGFGGWASAACEFIKLLVRK